jgi:hypothetical protein
MPRSTKTPSPAAPTCACEYCEDPERFDLLPAEMLPVGFSLFSQPTETPVRAHRTRHPAGGVDFLLICKDQPEPVQQPPTPEEAAS